MGNSAKKKLDAIEFNSNRIRRDKERAELAALPKPKVSKKVSDKFAAYMAITGGMQGWNSP